jgi:amino acid transporter
VTRKAGPLALTAILYFTVSGGPYGLEPLIAAVGPALAVTLLLVVPLVWAAPTAFMVAELSSALPVEGGFYRWVERAMGRFWAFQEAWWSWACSLPDMAIYPVLFTAYLGEFLHLSPPARWLVALAVIWTSTAMNLLGIRAVGASAVFAGIFVILPFLLFSYGGLTQAPQPAPPVALSGSFLVGLSVVLWNYTGWDNISLVGDEVENPQRTFPLALLTGLALITGMYLLPVLGGLRVAPDPAAWTEGAFPVFARSLPGGRWLSIWILAGALASMFTLFNSLLLSYSRLPFVVAQDGYLPPAFARVNQRGVPVVAVVSLSALASLLALLQYDRLVILYGLVYTLSLILEFLALWILRVREPQLPRPFRVPGGTTGLALTVILPLLVSAVVIVATLQDALKQPLWLAAAIGASLAGVPLYWLLRPKPLA